MWKKQPFNAGRENNEEEPSSSKTTIKREAVPFSIDNVTLTLFALKEGVIYE